MITQRKKFDNEVIGKIDEIIRNGEDWHVGHSVDSDVALTLIGIVSEDPETWEDIAACWARYRTPPVAEFLGGLPMRIRSEDVARKAIEATDSWLFVDLPQKRLLTEFAFSLCGTREEWEEQQREFEEFTAEFEREWEEHETTEESEPDEPEPTWNGYISDEPIPGDERDHLKMAFLLTEIVSVLKSQHVDSEVFGEINDRFTAFRNCRLQELHQMGRRLGDYLESLTDLYPPITSRVADFCSRVDEHICKVRSDEDDWPS